MAFPTIPTGGRVLTGVQANATATRTFPSLAGLTKNAGDLLVAICVAYQTTAVSGAAWGTWSAGWTEFIDQTGASSVHSIGAAWKVSDGTETALSVTQAATITGHAVFIVLSIPVAKGQAPEATAIATGTAAAADAASLSPSWGAEDTLWIALGAGGETATTGSWDGISVSGTAPTNYGNIAKTAQSGDVVGGVDAAVAFRQLNAASENVGVFGGVDTSNARNAELLIAVRAATAVVPATGGGSSGGSLVLSVPAAIIPASGGGVSGGDLAFAGTPLQEEDGTSLLLLEDATRLTAEAFFTVVGGGEPLVPAAGGGSSGGSLVVSAKEPLVLASGGGLSGGTMQLAPLVDPADGGGSSSGSLVLSAKEAVIPASGGGVSGGSMTLAPLVSPGAAGGTSGGSMTLSAPAPLVLASGGGLSGGALAVIGPSGTSILPASGGGIAGGSLDIVVTVILTIAPGGGISGGSLLITAKQPMSLASGGGVSGGSMTLAPLVSPGAAGGTSGGSMSLVIRTDVTPASGGGVSGGSLTVRVKQPLTFSTAGGTSGGSLALDASAGHVFSRILLEASLTLLEDGSGMSLERDDALLEDSGVFYLLEDGSSVFLMEGMGVGGELPDPTEPLEIVPMPVDPVTHVLTIEYPDGGFVRFGPSETGADYDLLSLSFDTEMPGGYDVGLFTVARPNDWVPDVHLLRGARLSRYEDDSTLWEGRVVQISGEDVLTIRCEGWSKALEDNQTARAIFIDRDVGSWSGPTTRYQIALIDDGFIGSAASTTPDPHGNPALMHEITGPWDAGLIPDSVGLYNSEGLGIARVDFVFLNDGIGDGGPVSQVDITLSLFDNADLAFYDPSVDNIDHDYGSAGGFGGYFSGTLIATPAKNFAGTDYYSYAATTAANFTSRVYATLLAVIGTHGLPLQGSVSAPNNGHGIYVSDMVAWIIENFAGQLNYTTGPEGSIEPTNYAVPHAVFKDAGPSSGMIESFVLLGGNSLLPMDWGCWENREFFMKTPGRYGSTWYVRTDAADIIPSVAVPEGEGADAAEKINGIVVSFNDGTGTTQTVGPPGSGADFETAALEDPDPNNPANADGEPRWATEDAGITDLTGATLIGQMRMRDRNSEEWRGQIGLSGFVRDGSGRWFPAANVHAGDYIVVENDPLDTRPRRVVSTSYTPGTVSASVGAPPHLFDSFVARLQKSIEGRL